MKEINQHLNQIEDRLLRLEANHRITTEDQDAILPVLAFLLEQLPDNAGTLFLSNQIQELGGALPVSHPLLELYELLCQRASSHDPRR